MRGFKCGQRLFCVAGVRCAHHQTVGANEGGQLVIPHGDDGQSALLCNQRLQQRPANGRAAHAANDNILHAGNCMQRQALRQLPRRLQLLRQAVNMRSHALCIKGRGCLQVVQIHG